MKEFDIEENYKKYLELFRLELVNQRLMTPDKALKVNLSEEDLGSYILDNDTIPISVMVYLYCDKDVPKEVYGGIHRPDDFLI